MAIKMRENKNKGSICEECLVKWNETKVMYDLMLLKNKTTLCSDCTETLFKKILTMQCAYNSKIKSQEDLSRKERMMARKNKGLFEHHPINPENPDEEE